MTSKKVLRRRIRELEAEIERDLIQPLPLTFDVLTVCFSDRTVAWAGRTVTTEANCLSIPFTSDRIMYVPLRTAYVTTDVTPITGSDSEPVV